MGETWPRMSIPTISTVTPGSGPTKGRYPVRIVGTGFRVPAAATTHPAPAPRAARVTFEQVVPAKTADGRVLSTTVTREATKVRVESETEMTCCVPIGDHGLYDGTTVPTLAASITIENLDDAGIPIPGETVTMAAAFTYLLPSLAKQTLLKAVIRALLQELKRQACPNVVLTSFTDFDDYLDDRPQNPAEPHLPSVTLLGPTLRINDLQETGLPRHELLTPTTEVRTYEDRRYWDVDFEVVGAVPDDLSENFMTALTEFFEANYVLHVVDPESGEQRSFNLELTDPFGASGGVAIDNVRSFRGACSLSRVELRGYAGYPFATQTGVGYTADRAVVQAERMELP